MVAGHIVARVGRSRLVVGPCISCSLRCGVALAPEILFFAPLSIVTKQDLLRTKGHKQRNKLDKTHGRSSVSGSGQTGRGRTREVREQYNMLRPSFNALVDVISLRERKW